MKNIDIIKAVTSAKYFGDLETANILLSVLFRRWAAFDPANDREPSIKLWYETTRDRNSEFELIAVEVNEFESYIPVPLVSSLLVGRMLHALAIGHPGVGVRPRNYSHRKRDNRTVKSAAHLLNGLGEEEIFSSAWTLVPLNTDTVPEMETA